MTKAGTTSAGARLGHRTALVSARSRAATRGILRLGTLTFPCALGRAGRRSIKREGDGATPVGTFLIHRALYRADRVVRPRSVLPVQALRRCDGWCDASSDRNYNRPVRHPYGASAEAMWRMDHLYDLVIVLGYNDRPRVRGRGSAIFLHVAPPGYAPTAGCIALSRRDILLLLERLRSPAVLRVDQ